MPEPPVIRPPTAGTPRRQPTSAWHRLARSLRGVLSMLFLRQLRVRRRGRGLALVLEHNHSKPGAHNANEGAAGEPTRPAELTQGELGALLDAAPGSRKLLRTLAAVEHGLKHKDPTGLFLFEVEHARLRAALRQLDGLAPQPPSAGLAALRGRIVDAVAVHEQRERRLEMLMPRSDLMDGNKLEVAEARPSDFDRASAQWRGKDPAA